MCTKKTTILEKYTISPSFKIIFILLAATSLCWCIYRDVQLEKQYTGDLRNRIVGARLQLDGQSPYFYKWKSTDSTRYYDPQNFDEFKVSNITASPFFHQLIYPIANLPQQTISKIWLVLEYLSLLLISILAILMASKRNNRWLVLFTSLLFLFSYAWIRHVCKGQLYIFIALFAMLFYYFLSRPHSMVNAVLTGIFATCLVLIRPTAFIFIIPFLLVIPKYAKSYLVTLFASSFILLLLAFGSNYSRQFWLSYREALKEQVNIHQQLNPSISNNEGSPKFSEWEGIQKKESNSNIPSAGQTENVENGNVFVIFKMAFSKNLSLQVITISCLIFIALLSIAFYRKYSNTNNLTIYSIAIIGFCLYMSTDIFSPVHRFGYNSVQWIFPLLLIASHRPVSFRKIWFAGLAAGFLLNSIPFTFLPMQRTMGEYIVYACIIGSLLITKPASTI